MLGISTNKNLLKRMQNSQYGRDFTVNGFEIYVASNNVRDHKKDNNKKDIESFSIKSTLNGRI